MDLRTSTDEYRSSTFDVDDTRDDDHDNDDDGDGGDDDNGVFNDDEDHDNEGDDNTRAAYRAGARSRGRTAPRSAPGTVLEASWVRGRPRHGVPRPAGSVLPASNHRWGPASGGDVSHLGGKRCRR